MVSAMGAAGAEVTLVLPIRWGLKDHTVETPAEYGVEPTFQVTSLRSVYLCIRGIEKLASGVVAPRCEAARQADVSTPATSPSSGRPAMGAPRSSTRPTAPGPTRGRRCAPCSVG